jgi:hypothetical protein
MRAKKGNFVHSKGNLLPVSDAEGSSPGYATAIAAALRSDASAAGHGAKVFMKWSGASERAVKGWLSGRRGPSGAHLIRLMAHSDAVFVSVLWLAERRNELPSANLAESRQLLRSALTVLEKIAP